MTLNPLREEDVRMMSLALTEAKKAADRGEVPVGALVTHGGEVLSRAHNLRETMPSGLAHAELLAIDRATKKLGRWRLSGCTLYVTLEPCVMCAGAIVQSRVDRVVFGARDPKAGAVVSVFQLLGDSRLNHRPPWAEGPMAQECGQILTEFFKRRRVEQKGG
ncbi:MAG: nucleoside deaminase [Bdellovibrionales bacterium]|nr:nucleoside deaminase [Bdellovibrionales bacterium]